MILCGFCASNHGRCESMCLVTLSCLENTLVPLSFPAVSSWWYRVGWEVAKCGHLCISLIRLGRAGPRILSFFRNTSENLVHLVTFSPAHTASVYLGYPVLTYPFYPGYPVLMQFCLPGVPRAHAASVYPGYPMLSHPSVCFEIQSRDGVATGISWKMLALGKYQRIN